MHSTGNGTMVNGTIRGVLGSLHGPLPGEAVDARRRDWKQWGTHGGGPMAHRDRPRQVSSAL